MEPNAERPDNPAERGTRWAVTGFYLLIALEFFYMVSPFAAFLYSVYRPGLGFLRETPTAAWLISFFLPHFVDTRSVVIETARIAGPMLLLSGLIVFIVGAGQIYIAKLRRRGVVTGGLYRILRHPQYTGLAVAGLGMTLVWPRILVLPFYVGMLFAYNALARTEERECERKYGEAYREFMARTGRFLPFPIPGLRSVSGRQSPLARFAITLALVLGATAGSIAIAIAAHHLTVSSVYAHYTDGTAWIARSEMSDSDVRRLTEIALRDEAVRNRLDEATVDSTSRAIAYLLREGEFVSEIPMNKPPGARGHDRPTVHDGRSYRIVFTSAVLRTRRDVEGKDILLNAVATEPLFEIELDSVDGRVTRLAEPAEARYEGVPVPVL